MDNDIVLVIGDKAWSSWSLRPWLAAKVARVPFREVSVKLRQAGTAEEISRFSPSGRVPVLKHGALTVWDSLAICEYLAEIAPEAHLWPGDRNARAIARSVAAEMHSSFPALRQDLSMNFHARLEGQTPSAAAAKDIARIVSVWRQMRATFGADGPFLFGGFTIADAMMAPVATRFRTYGVELSQFGDDGQAQAYAAALLVMPELQEWGEGAARG